MSARLRPKQWRSLLRQFFSSRLEFYLPLLEEMLYMVGETERQSAMLLVVLVVLVDAAAAALVLALFWLLFLLFCIRALRLRSQCPWRLLEQACQGGVVNGSFLV